MDLFVIVLCLLCERFLMHKSAYNRFHWFTTYANAILGRIPSLPTWSQQALIVLPIISIAAIVLYITGDWLFNIVGIMLNIVVFYYCLGPVNPFYPVHDKAIEHMTEDDIGLYLIRVNNELFAVLFWYLILGPVGILTYRLISLSQGLTPVGYFATHVLNILDWFPARMTSLLYLLVGNFQSGYHHFSRLFFSTPIKNNIILSTCGVAALDNPQPKTILQAENHVEHATIVFLVLLAFCTIVAWM